jgi:transcriptional regulator with XRE-family HTH domain
MSQVAEAPARAPGAVTTFAAVPAQTHLQAVRKARGWSQGRAISELARVAAHRGVRVPAPESLKVQLSRWENGHGRPDGFYTELLCEMYAAEPYELGIVSQDAQPDDPARLRRGAQARMVEVQRQIGALTAELGYLQAVLSVPLPASEAEPGRELEAG